MLCRVANWLTMLQRLVSVRVRPYTVHVRTCTYKPYCTYTVQETPNSVRTTIDSSYTIYYNILSLYTGTGMISVLWSSYSMYIWRYHTSWSDDPYQMSSIYRRALSRVEVAVLGNDLSSCHRVGLSDISDHIGQQHSTSYLTLVTCTSVVRTCTYKPYRTYIVQRLNSLYGRTLIPTPLSKLSPGRT